MNLKKIPPLCNIFYSLEQPSGKIKATKINTENLFAAFKKGFLICNFVIISTLLSETLGH